MVGDGFGPAPVTLTRLFAQRNLMMDRYLVGVSHTPSATNLVTDSAAAATALATGKKTYNGAVGLDYNGNPIVTVLERARDRGYATGVVVTCEITHATPAGFTAHVKDRGLAEEIALQQSAANITVMFGGGRAKYVNREDKRNLLEEMRRKKYMVLTHKDEFYRLNLTTPIIGLFADGHFDYEIEKTNQQPHLPELTKKAIELLEKAGGDKGFFLLVEGSKIDHALHDNDARTAIEEAIAYDQAFAVAVDYAMRKGNTLVIAVADHDTGALTLGNGDYEWFPEVLRKVKTSAHYIVRAMKTQSVRKVMLELAGIDLTPEEEALIKYSANDDERRANVNKVINTRAGIHFAHGSHTGVSVNLYAFGPEGSYSDLRGSTENTEIPRCVSDFLGLDFPRGVAEMFRIRPRPTPKSVIDHEKEH